MKVTMVLADAATVSEGKLNLLGAGWNLIGPQPARRVLATVDDAIRFSLAAHALAQKLTS